MANGKTKGLKSHEIWFWVFLMIFTVLTVLTLPWIISTTKIEYTYFQDPVNPGPLYSERWSFDHWVLLSYGIWFLALMTAGFMMWDHRLTFPKILHLILVVLLLIWLIVVLAFHISYWARANESEGDGGFENNLANDDRYCCVFGLANTDCPNNQFASVCAPAVGAGDLIIPATFWLQFWVEVAIIIFIIIDIIMTALYIRYARISIEQEDLLPSSEGSLVDKRINSSYNSNYNNISKQQQQYKGKKMKLRSNKKN